MGWTARETKVGPAHLASGLPLLPGPRGRQRGQQGLMRCWWPQPLVWCALIYDARSLHSSVVVRISFFFSSTSTSSPLKSPASPHPVSLCCGEPATDRSFLPSPVEAAGLARGLRCDGDGGGVGGPWRSPSSPSTCSWLPPCSPSPLLRWLGAVSRPLPVAPPPSLPSPSAFGGS
jgi:hypothetical protein